MVKLIITESRIAGIMKLFVTLEMSYRYMLFKRKCKMPCPKKKAQVTVPYILVYGISRSLSHVEVAPPP